LFLFQSNGLYFKVHRVGIHVAQYPGEDLEPVSFNGCEIFAILLSQVPATRVHALCISAWFANLLDVICTSWVI